MREASVDAAQTRVLEAIIVIRATCCGGRGVERHRFGSRSCPGASWRLLTRDVDARKHRIVNRGRAGLSDEKVPRGGRRHCDWRG